MPATIKSDKRQSHARPARSNRRDGNSYRQEHPRGYQEQALGDQDSRHGHEGDQKTAIEKKPPWRWCLMRQNQYDANHDSKPCGNAQQPMPRRHGFTDKKRVDIESGICNHSKKALVKMNAHFQARCETRESGERKTK